MGFLVILLALSPIVAAAQNLGTFQITSGGDVPWSIGANPGPNNGAVEGKGFSGYLTAAPQLLSYPDVDLFYGGDAPLSFCFGCRLPGTYDGVGTFSVTPMAGLVQSDYPYGFMDETGEVNVAGIGVTGAGTYTAPFDMFAKVEFGPTYNVAPTAYADFVGRGTVALDVGPATCYSAGHRGPLEIESVTYTFAPELDPATLSGALTLLAGGLLMLRGPRSAPNCEA